jgi:hypothetical protein
VPDTERSAHRWWGLDRRQTVLALLGAALVGVLVVAVANLAGSGGGRAAARDEVWVFGSRTVAAPPSLAGTRAVPGTAFGSVVGAPGRVWMYDPGSHELGWYDGVTSRIERLPHAPGGSTLASTSRPLVAPVAGHLWLAPSPGVLADYDLDRRRVVRRVDTDIGAASSAVVATRGRVVSAAETSTGLSLRVVDPASGKVVGSADVAGFGALHGLAADGRSVWAVGDGQAVRFGVATLQQDANAALQPGDGTLGGAVVAEHDLYVLRGADQLVQVRPDGSSSVVSQLRGTGSWPPALNASLTGGAGNVYALVPVGVNANDHSGRLLGYDVRLGRATRALEFSSAFFAGGLAFSTR